jgi:hypothetical protein
MARRGVVAIGAVVALCIGALAQPATASTSTSSVIGTDSLAASTTFRCFYNFTTNGAPNITRRYSFNILCEAPISSFYINMIARTVAGTVAKDTPPKSCPAGIGCQSSDQIFPAAGNYIVKTHTRLVAPPNGIWVGSNPQCVGYGTAVLSCDWVDVA